MWQWFCVLIMVYRLGWRSFQQNKNSRTRRRKKKKKKKKVTVKVTCGKDEEEERRSKKLIFPISIADSNRSF